MRAKGLKKLATRYKRGCSGTISPNRVDELWSPLNWMFSKQYSSYWRFFEEHILYTMENYNRRWVRVPKGQRNIKKLQRTIEPFTARITKEQLGKTLPKLPAHVISFDLAPKVREAYRALVKENLAWIEQLPDDRALVTANPLTRLIRLRQFCDAYCWLDDDGKVHMSEPSPKLDILEEVVASTDDKIVVWTEFRQMVFLAAKRFDKLKIPYVTFVGGMSKEEQALAKKKFIEGDARLFLATRKTGGTGTDGLQLASSTCFDIDESWSPVDNVQAHDRLDRPGQKAPLQIIVTRAKRTVDMRVVERLEMKRKWFRQLMEGLEG